MTQQSLRSKTTHAVGWSATELLGRHAANFVIGIVLARILLPEQFGLIGVLSVFIVAAQVFADSGLAAALIQKQDADDTDCCTIFYANIFFSVLVCGALCLAAPWIARAFDEPPLAPLTCALSLTIVINSVGMIHGTLLTKSIDFRSRTAAVLSAVILSGILGVALALHGFGIWSLAVQRISSDAVRVILFWKLCAWRPSLTFSFQSLRSLLGFGGRVLATAVFGYLTKPFYYAVIARIYSPASLGFVTRGSQLQELPSRTLTAVVSRVTFPVFSAIQENRPRVKRGMQRVLKAMISMVLPLMIGLAVIAKPLVVVLLTEKWLPCAPYLQLMCVVGVFMPIQALHRQLLMALGHAAAVMRSQILMTILHLLVLAITFRAGILIILCGQVSLEILTALLLGYLSGKQIGYPIAEQLRDNLPSLGVSCAVLAGMCAVAAVGGSNPWILLISQAFSGLLIFGLLGSRVGLGSFVEARRFLGHTAA